MPLPAPLPLSVPILAPPPAQEGQVNSARTIVTAKDRGPSSRREGLARDRPSRRGARPPASMTAPCSSPSIGAAVSPSSACTPPPSPASYGGRWPPQEPTPLRTRPTPCERGWPRRQRRPGYRRGRSWRRLATAAWSSPAATSGRGLFSERTPPRPSGCRRGAPQPADLRSRQRPERGCGSRVGQFAPLLN